MALRAFALVDRESIADERDTAITTDCIRLHRLVREVAAERCRGRTREDALRALVHAMTAAYPRDVYDNPANWPRARRLDAIALSLVMDDVALPDLAGSLAVALLDDIAAYRYRVLGSANEARPLLERALAICEEVSGPEHADTAPRINNLAILLWEQRELAAARPLAERALAVAEKVYGRQHPNTASSLTVVGLILKAQGNLAESRLALERALVINEKAFGSEHASLAGSLYNLALLLQEQGEFAAARPLLERSRAINEKTIGPDHPNTAMGIWSLATLLSATGDGAAALPMYQRALAIFDKVLGPEHPGTKQCATHAAWALAKLDRAAEAKALRAKYGIKD